MVAAVGFAFAGESQVTGDDAGAGGARELTIEESVGIALRQNPDILKARQEIERTRGAIIEVTARALPRVQLVGSYNQTDPRLLEGSRGGRSGGGGDEQPEPTQAPAGGAGQQNSDQENGNQPPQTQQTGQQPAEDFTSGGGGFSSQDKSWRVAIEARQVLYAGGQVRAAMRTAQIARDISLYQLRDTIDRVIADVRKQFYTVLLNRALIGVQEQSVNLLESELEDQRARFDAGTVPRFNVLRAEVELANARPDLIRARNNFTIAKLQLTKTLGLGSDETGRPRDVHAKGRLTVNGAAPPLDIALDAARTRRPFLKAQRHNILIETEQIKIAYAGYKPRLQASGGYEARNSRLSNDLDDTVDGWFFGVQGSWNIFDGFETHGKLKQARARLESARVNYDDSVQQVELEVQQALSQLHEALALVESQQKNVESAEEALRLARERLSAGAGTQLDLLDARVALTRAQVTELQARHEYNVARAELDRVTATDTEYTEMFDDPLVRKQRQKEQPPR